MFEKRLVSPGRWIVLFGDVRTVAPEGQRRTLRQRSRAHLLCSTQGAPPTLPAVTYNRVRPGTLPAPDIHSDRKSRVGRVGCKIAEGHGMSRPAGCYHNIGRDLQWNKKKP